MLINKLWVNEHNNMRLIRYLILVVGLINGNIGLKRTDRNLTGGHQ